MATIQHPAYVLRRGRPSRASIGTATYDLTDDGTFEVEDDEDAVAAMDRLAETYGVEYSAEGEIIDGAPVDADADSEDTADDADTDGDPTSDALDALGMDALRDRAHEAGVDTDAVDMRQRNEIEAAIVRQQANGVASADADADE